MNVLFISRGIPTKKDPMWGNFEFEQAQAIKNLGHNVALAIIDRRTRLKWRKIGISRSQRDGIKIFCIFLFPLPKILPVKFRKYIEKWMILFLYKKIENECGRPDIVHAHYLSNIANATVLKEKYHIPIVGTEHFSKVISRSTDTKIRFLCKNCYQKVDMPIAVSRSLATHIKAHYNVDFKVINNMCDTSLFCYNAENREKKAQNQFVFVSVGSLIQGKNFLSLIEAFYNAKFDNNVYLHIVGEGGERPKLEKLIKKYNLQHNIKLFGMKTRLEIAEILQNSDAFVLPSMSETFGVVYIEAMASGLPIIATKCGGPEEFIEEFMGILIPINDVKTLTESLIEMYNNIENYDKKRIANECRLRFSPDIIAKQLEEKYIAAISMHQ